MVDQIKQNNEVSVACLNQVIQHASKWKEQLVYRFNDSFYANDLSLDKRHLKSFKIINFNLISEYAS